MGNDMERIISNKFFLDHLKKLARTELNILLQGETGTGKNLLAEMIHRNSSRKREKFVYVDCTTLRSELLASELFGHEKGAFTGALEQKMGKFEYANKGIIFLDEIGELDLELQPKLLRVLHEGIFERVGGVESVKVDVRIITATNMDLEKAVMQGRFRRDLFYRLNALTVKVPPLRQRREEIPDLVGFILKETARRLNKKRARISPDALDYLMNYSWPGNIRELKNVMERAINLQQESILTKKAFDLGTNYSDVISISVREIEKRKLLQALEKHGGRITRVARELSISRGTVYKRMKLYHINTKNKAVA